MVIRPCWFEIEKDLDFSKMLEVLENNKEIIESVEYKVDETQNYSNIAKFIKDMEAKGITVNELEFETDENTASES